MIFSPVFNAWESLADLARDLTVEYQTVASWKTRDSIPAAYHSDLAKKAAERGITNITVELLADLAKQRRVN